MSDQERAYERKVTERPPIAGTIELSNVNFRYAETEPMVLNDLSLRIEQGECVAIVGLRLQQDHPWSRSCSGCSSRHPARWTIDGVALPVFGERAYRRQVATVQDDYLLTGSILQNICFFEEDPDAALLSNAPSLPAFTTTSCACRWATARRSAASATPCRPASASALLARALYRRPRVLILDESTANLDVDLERRINETLMTLSITRIHVAHRPQTIALADRVIELGRPGERDRIRTALRAVDPTRASAT